MKIRLVCSVWIVLGTISWMLGTCVVSRSVRAADPPDAEGVKFFEAKIRPVLVRHCYECHSEQSDDIQGNFRVDSREALRRGGDNGVAVVPGRADDGFLLPVLRYEEDDYQMPPSGKLPDDVIADFKRWIEMGAPDPRD